MTISSAAGRNRSGLGIAYMAMGMFLFSAVDAQGKFLTEGIHPSQIAWSRHLGLVLGVVILLLVRGGAVLRTASPGLQIGRGICAAGSATFFLTALNYVPLADAVAVSFVAPFMVTLLGAFVLGERVGIRRWSAVIIGFLGALIVIRPGLGVIHPAVFLVILAAFLFAIRQVLSRALGATSDSTATTVAYTALVAGAILTLPLPFIFTWPLTTGQIAILAAMALLAAVAEICVIRALEVAQAVVVAPVQYSLLIWGTLYGFLIFAELPDFWTLFGAAIIMATGVYTFHREFQLSRSGET